MEDNLHLSEIREMGEGLKSLNTYYIYSHERGKQIGVHRPDTVC